MKNGSRHVISTDISRQLVIIEHRKQFVSMVLLRSRSSSELKKLIISKILGFLKLFLSVQTFLSRIFGAVVQVHLHETRGFVQ